MINSRIVRQTGGWVDTVDRWMDRSVDLKAVKSHDEREHVLFVCSSAAV